MDLKTSIIFTVTFCILIYHGEEIVVSVLIFPSRHEDSTSSGETFVIMIFQYFGSLPWMLKYICM